MYEMIMVAAVAQALFAWEAAAEMGKGVQAAALPRREVVKLQPSVGQAKKLAELAAKYDYPIAQVRSLRERGLGWGEIDHTLAMAKSVEKPPDEIADLREKGFGWWDISVKLAPLVREPERGSVLADSSRENGDGMRDAVREETSVRRSLKERPPRP